MSQELKHDEPGVMEIPDINYLNLLYTGDIKGEVEQMAYLATIVNQIRASSNNVILVDSGDWATGTRLADSFKGMPMVEIFNSIGYDAAGIGESEIELDNNGLFSLGQTAKFPFVNCNIVDDTSGKAPGFFKKYVIIEKGPFKVAITGAANTGNYPGSKLAAKDPLPALSEVLKEIKVQKPDVIVFLSRFEFEENKSIARRFPEINVVIGGGSQFLPKPYKEGNTFICHPGEKAQNVGSLEITMEAVIRITKAD